MAEKQSPGQGQGQGQNRQTSGRRQKKLTEYGVQLKEKQRTRGAYGLRERQFRGYFTQASKFRGQTGIVLLQLLERRLDNVIFRAGLARTRAQARQFISHRHFAINGHRVTVPSMLVGSGEVITFKKSELISPLEEVKPAPWLKVDAKAGKISVNHLPSEADLPIEFDTQKIIEFYSR